MNNDVIFLLNKIKVLLILFSKKYNPNSKEIDLINYEINIIENNVTNLIRFFLTNLESLETLIELIKEHLKNEKRHQVIKDLLIVQKILEEDLQKEKERLN